MSYFLHQIDNIFTEEECQTLLERAFEKGWTPVDNGLAKYQRAVIIDDNLAEILFDKIEHLLPETYKNQRIVKLNNYFRFSRYIPGGRFKIHKDGINSDSDGNRAIFTLNIFLNDDFEGGGTIFYKNNNKNKNKNNILMNIRPKTARAGLFYNQIDHEGEIVTKGFKYLLRTDVMASVL